MICSTGLVMGAGNAKACKLAFPGINKVLAKYILHGSIFGIKLIYIGDASIIAFQTKVRWDKPSTLGIIKLSVEKLKDLAEYSPDLIFHLPFPGCGHGGLKRNDVLPLLETLPRNVWIYEP
jgi:hypothetical protein